MVEKMDRVYSEFIDYLLYRIDALKKENRQLKMELSASHTPVNQRTSIEGKENSNVSQRVLEASEKVARARILPPGMRPDLDIHKQGRKLVAKVKADDLASVKKMVNDNKSLLSMRSGKSGETVLHIACAAGAKKTVQYLLTRDDVDPLARDVFGRTALHYAGDNYQDEVSSFFVEKVGNVVGENAPQDMAGLTPAGCAALKKPRRVDEKNKRERVIRSLHANGDHCISPAVQKHKRKSRLSSELPIVYGHSSMPGFRVSMEDAICIATEVVIPKAGDQKFSIFGVFDGHGGAGAAKFCADRLLRVFREQPLVQSGEVFHTEAALQEALIRTCWDLEDEMSKCEDFVLQEVVVREAMGDEERKTEFKANDNSGTTALILVVCKEFYAIANVGDCRAVLSTKLNGVEEAVPLSRDHKPMICAMNENDEDNAKEFFLQEKERIENAGGAITEDGYTLWDANKPKEKLAMTRSIGDFQFKQTKTLPRELQAITAEPEVLVKQNSTSDNYIFMACDGIWDVMSNADVINLIRAEMDPEHGLDNVCQQVLLNCLHLKSEDNMTAILVAWKNIQSSLF